MPPPHQPTPTHPHTLAQSLTRTLAHLHRCNTHTHMHENMPTLVHIYVTYNHTEKHTHQSAESDKCQTAPRSPFHNVFQLPLVYSTLSIKSFLYMCVYLYVCVYVRACVCVNAYVHVSGMCTCVCVYYQIMYVFR
mmetsp:Transcript_100589/g.162203  ORF Transcript_100589/g.162203 Transcript_100589/m.162203 type:complete len:135 (-) Transcript_100589:108-512(-)